MTIFSDPGFRVNGPDKNPIDDAAELVGELPDDVEADADDVEADADDVMADADTEIDTDTDEPEMDLDEAEGVEEDLGDETDGHVEDLEEDIDADADRDEDLADELDAEEDAPRFEEAEIVEVQPEHGPAPAVMEQSIPMPPIETAALWSTGQIMAVAQRALAVFVVMGLIGYGLGALRGSSSTARAEFVYTLDESVPDSFLREDRRLLTQVVTFKSDAVLTPVAEEFDLSVDALRAKIDVQTLDLSEVLRLDVTDADETRAIAISRAVLDRYLQVITDATPAGDSQELDLQRVEVTTQLAAADSSRQELATARQQDVALELQQESIARQINLKNQQLDRLQGSLDDALVQNLTAASRTALRNEFAAAEKTLAALEAELAGVGAERAALVTATTTEPALLREIDRLESILTTIDDELAQRDLGPLVASPIRELSEPIVLHRSRHIVGLQGMALGLMAALPLAALVAYRARKRQLWSD